MTKYYSFDIFDTLITRRTVTAKGIFLLMQKRLRVSLPSELKNNFYDYRIEAENIARLNPNKDEVSLSDIYALMKNKFDLHETDIVYMQELEIEVELENVVPIKDSIIALKKIPSKQTLFISDMYLPRKAIIKLLNSAGIDSSNIRLYLSSELNKTKNKGTLFEYVLNDLNIKANNLSHYGDNVYADIYIPNKKGIKTKLYQKGNLSEFEKSLLQNEKNITEQIVVGALRYLRINQQGPLYESGLTLGALPFFLYTYWCLESSKQLKIDTLHFISRDGQILYEIAKLIQKFSKETYPKLNYFYSSRYASYISNLKFPLTYKSMENLFPDSDLETLETIISKLKLDPYKTRIYDMFTKYSKRELSKIEQRTIIEAIIKDLELMNYINTIFTEQQELAIQYYRQEGLNHGSNAIIDIGWMGTTYQSITASMKKPKKLYGLFFGFKSFNYSLYQQKIFVYFTKFFEQKFINANLLEFLASGNHGSVIGYKNENEKIKPIFNVIDKNQFSPKELQLLRQAYLDFAVSISTVFTNNDINSNDAEILLNRLSVNMLTLPKNIVKPFIKYTHSTNVNDGNAIEFIAPVRIKELFLNIFFNKAIVRGWLEGSWSITPKYINLSNKILLMNKKMIKYLFFWKR